VRLVVGPVEELDERVRHGLDLIDPREEAEAHEALKDVEEGGRQPRLRGVEWVLPAVQALKEVLNDSFQKHKLAQVRNLPGGVGTFRHNLPGVLSVGAVEGPEARGIACVWWGGAPCT